ncbi:hypothetical protein ACGFNU_38645 [Spirillospora sp. NPDC048911]|uniref:hypothetical protein n=1 Tax=Spirillospora sp. NPDC048911 TaxID=3364527 RepID=UPI0037170C1D
MLLPDDMTQVSGLVGEDVTRLVLSTSINGPAYQVPLLPGPVAGRRIFVFHIDHYAGTRLDTYTADGKLACICGDKLSSG